MNMIAIYNGHERSLGESREHRYLLVSTAILLHLHALKGCRLSVLLALSMSANELGLTNRDETELAHLTGYNKNTVCYALKDLCHLKINGQPLLTLTDAGFQLFPLSNEIELAS